MVGESSQNTLKQLGIIGIILAVIGLVISLYSIQHHLDVKASGATDAFCNINQTFSCDDVANSKYSEDPWGNPLGVYGAGYFLGLIVLLGVALTKENHRRDALHGFTALVVIGALVSLILGSVSYFAIGSFCLTCIGIYLVCFLLAGILFFSRDAIPGGFDFKSLTNGGSYALMTLLLAIAIFQMTKPPAGSPDLVLDEPRSPAQLDEIMKQMEAKKKALERNQEILKIDRSPYSGLGEDYRKGSDEAKVVIVKFADFQCPSCAQAATRLKQIHQEFGDQVQIVYKNFPLNSQCNDGVQQQVFQYTCEASILTRCAGQYGKFWQLHDKIFENQSRIDRQRLELWALEAGLTSDQIEECRNSKDIMAKIKQDAQQATALGITGTPTIFINGMRVDAGSVEQLRFHISNLLSR
ncbi:MAG: vitamin K epoxide reductase family protein [Oligoflexus sp.]